MTLSGHDRVMQWDVKESDGSAGASLTKKGAKLGKFKASFYLVVDPNTGLDEVAEWDDDFAPILREAMAGEIALDVYHPDLADSGFTSVVVEKIGGKKHDGRGGVTIEVDFIEYAPPKKATASPKGSATSKKKKGDDPNAAAKAELQALVNEAKSL